MSLIERSSANISPARTDNFGVLERRKAEFDQQESIKNDVLTIAADWLEATDGIPIAQDEYERLYDVGYAVYNKDEFADIFADWEKLQELSEAFLKARQAEKIAQDSMLLKQIQDDCLTGILPVDLLYSIQTYTENNPNPKGRPLSRGKILKGAPTQPLEVIRRYHAYRFAKHIFKAHLKFNSITGDLEQPSDSWMAGLAIGYSLDTQRPFNGLLTQLKQTHGKLPEGALEEAIDDLGVSEYIYPESRQNDLKELLALGGKIKPEAKLHKQRGTKTKPEYFYDTRQQQLVVLGRTALSEFTASEGREYLELMHKTGRLILRESLDSSSNLVPFRTALTAESIEIDNVKKRSKKSEEWQAKESLAYGRWIIDILKDNENDDDLAITEKIIVRSFQMHTGPSVARIKQRFGSLSNFYTKLKATESLRIGQYDRWKPKKAIQHLQNLGREMGLIPSTERITQRINNGNLEPSGWALAKIITGNRKKFSQALEASGFVHAVNWSDADYIKWGLAYRLGNEGRVPTTMALNFLSPLGFSPATPPIRRLYGSLGNYQRILLASELPSSLEDLDWDKGHPYLYENIQIEEEELKRMSREYNKKRKDRANQLAVVSA